MQDSKLKKSKRDDVFDSAGYHVPTPVSFLWDRVYNMHLIFHSIFVLGSKSKLERWSDARRCRKYQTVHTVAQPTSNSTSYCTHGSTNTSFNSFNPILILIYLSYTVRFATINLFVSSSKRSRSTGHQPQRPPPSTPSWPQGSTERSQKNS